MRFAALHFSQQLQGDVVGKVLGLGVVKVESALNSPHTLWSCVQVDRNLLQHLQVDERNDKRAKRRYYHEQGGYITPPNIFGLSTKPYPQPLPLHPPTDLESEIMLGFDGSLRFHETGKVGHLLLALRLVFRRQPHVSPVPHVVSTDAKV